MITFVGAGPGAEDLITVRGQNKLKEADVVIYAGSLVNPALLKMCREECEIYNSAEMTLEEVMEVMIKGESSGKKVVRLHTGDPCLYGAIKEQMDELDRRKIPFEDCPGVSSFCGAAAALKAEYTLPGISQSVVITRMAGRTPVPEKESIRSFAAHQATMVLFLSTGINVWLPSVIISAPLVKIWSAEVGVIPLPSLAFSPLHIVKSIDLIFFKEGSSFLRNSQPFFPTTSPIHKILIYTHFLYLYR